MRTLALALVVSGMLTVEQRDAWRGNLDEPSVVVSADGRYVAFMTYSQLVDADSDRRADIYVLDRLGQRVELESLPLNGVDVPVSGHPGISGDGRFLVYESDISVVLRDRSLGSATIVGVGRQPAISADGAVVVFTAEHSAHLSEADVNGERDDIYAVDLRSGHVSRISVQMAGVLETTASSVSPSVSGDGRYVAFAVRQPIEGGRKGRSRIFVRDIVSGITQSIASGWNPSISGDGRYVTFVDTSRGLSQVYLTDLQSGKTLPVSRNVKGSSPNGASVNPTISADGRFVAFQSEASDLVNVEDFNLLWDVFLFDRATGETSRVSGDSSHGWMEPSTGPAIDAMGTIVAFSSRHPTDAGDKHNDFDLYVASYGAPERQLASARSR
jgi:Tol biopolymer transport system component